MKFSISKSFHVTLVLCSLADCGIRVVLPGFPNVFLALLVYENPEETLGAGGVQDAIEKLTCKNCYKINTVMWVFLDFALVTQAWSCSLQK